MKHLVFLFSLLLIPALGKAQYNNTYNPYLTAALTAEAIDNQQLDNIRFDENAIKQNLAAWETYQTYLGQVEKLSKKHTVYSVLMFSGLGIMASSIIPLCIEGGYAYDDPRVDKAFAWEVGLLGAGTVIGTIGVIGSIVQLSKVKSQKKEFIYYLKTTNNGVGIVTLF